MDSWDVGKDFLEWYKKNYPIEHKERFKEFCDKTFKKSITSRAMSMDEVRELAGKALKEVLNKTRSS